MGFEAKNYPQITQIFKLKAPRLNPLRSVSSKHLTGQAKLKAIRRLPRLNAPEAHKSS